MMRGRWKAVSVIIGIIMVSGIISGCGTEAPSGEERPQTEITNGITGADEPREEENTHKHEMTREEGEEATCEEAGRAGYWRCTACGKKYREKEGLTEIINEEELIEEARGHEYGKVQTEKEANCEENGREYRECMRCGKRTDETEREATGHKWGNGTVIRPATCESAGIIEYVCERCNGKHREETAKSEHEYTETRVYATCEIEGYTEHACVKCGEIYIDGVTEKTAHENETRVTEPTCAAAGKEVTECRVCGEKTEREIPKLEHEYKIKTVKATCESAGYTEHECAECGGKYKDGYEPATGHEYGEWAEKERATCTMNGEEERECGKCGAIETRETEAQGHETADGKCEKCGYTEPLEYALTAEGTYRLIGIGGYTGKEIRIPDEYEGIAVTEIAEGAFSGNTEIEHVTVGKNVKRIGKEAFYGCKKIKSITFEETEGWYTATTATAKNGAAAEVRKSAEENAKNLTGNIYGKLYWHRK